MSIYSSAFLSYPGAGKCFPCNLDRPGPEGEAWPRPQALPAVCPLSQALGGVGQGAGASGHLGVGGTSGVTVPS